MKSYAPSCRDGRPRFARLAFVGFLTAATLTVAPVAQADTLASVRSHVHAADSALHAVAAAAAGGSVSGPLADLEAQLRAAGHASAKLYRHAHSAEVRVRAATAITKLAAQQNRDAIALTPVLGLLSGTNQADLAGFITSVTQSREQALNLVTQLLGRLPAVAQAPIAGVVAQLAGAGAGAVSSLAGSITPGSIACPAIDAVSGVIATVLGSVAADLTRVQSILALLPAGGAAQFTGILNGLPTELNSLVASLKQSFNCSSTAPASSNAGRIGGGGVVGSALGMVGSVVTAVTQLVQSLLGGLLPGIGSGHAPVAGSTPVASLLGQGGPIAGFGALFGGFLGGGLPGLGG